MALLQAILVLSCLLPSIYGQIGRPKIKTTLGSVRGTYQTSANGKVFSNFEGIPYAKPPIGNLRFEPPEPVEPWLGTWDANFTLACAQTVMTYVNNTGEMDEDCLYLNIYVPRARPSPQDNLDVLVHIHGGAFMYGSSHWYTNPSYIMDKDLILVTFNYRLGILGFLSTEDEVVPGNMGLKDQVVALKWIQSHIANFGGNPKSVTLTGASAGASSVHLHYLSPMSQNLFQRGFSSSGVALNSFVLQKGASGKTRKLAEGVGCPTGTTETMIQCLKQRPYQHLLAQMSLFFILPYVPVAPFAPVVEKAGAPPFLDENPFMLMYQGKVQDLPWVASNTPHEGLVPVMFDLDLDTINLFWEFLAPVLLDFDHSVPENQWTNVTNKIKNFYLKGKPITYDNFYDFVQIFTDRMFLVDAERAVRLQAQKTKSSVYYLRFNYIGDDNANKTVKHCEDVKYYFGGLDKPLSPDESKMRELMLNMWASFAKTGKPEFTGVDWEPTKYEELTYLNINGTDGFQVLKSPHLAPSAFWDGLGLEENENLLRDRSKY